MGKHKTQAITLGHITQTTLAYWVQAKLRASKAAHKLEDFAHESETVMLVGHGIINRLITKQLLSNGWNGPNKPSANYWNYSCYEK